MGELIVLSRADRPSRPAASPEHSAEILFFTGVRYYRMAEEEAPPAKTRRRGRTPSARSLGKMRIDAQA